MKQGPFRGPDKGGSKGLDMEELPVVQTGWDSFRSLERGEDSADQILGGGVFRGSRQAGLYGSRHAGGPGVKAVTPGVQQGETQLDRTWVDDPGFKAEGDSMVQAEVEGFLEQARMR